ncbi:MAG: AhpC/TSA family protein [Alistipes sp.]|nr:AhpC/TSA family protein [Alistipes sp.]
MKRFSYSILATLLAALSLVGCKSTSVNISGKFMGLNAKMVYLEQMSATGHNLIDSVALTQSGDYHFTIENVADTPTLYNLIYNNDRIPLLVSRGEDIEVNALGNALSNYTVSGSFESELLRKFNKEFIDGQRELSRTVQRYPNAEGIERQKLTELYNIQYRDIKRKQISFIIEHKENVAAIYALYQRLPNEQYLVGADSDLIYYRTVADALAKQHRTSPYLITLSNDIARMEARISLLNSIETRTYPELTGTDMYGNKVKLSSLEGNIILVDFWSAELGNSNAFNAELKAIYEKYEGEGFRVYQVSADTSKATWVTAVQEQRLPWISVCDFMGEASPLLGAYNVRKLPSNFLIDRKGNIIDKDLYSTALDRRLEELFK